MFDLVKLSRTMSHALRHDPASYGISLDADGWVEISALLKGLQRRNAWKNITRADLERAAQNGDKPRYEFAGERIRARHGHSVEQKIIYTPSTPPAYLYHGTNRGSLTFILEDGLKAMNRQYVHLTTSVEEAAKVGDRKKGQTVILQIDATQAHKDGLLFYQTSDIIWLADHIPATYIKEHL